MGHTGIRFGLPPTGAAWILYGLLFGKNTSKIQQQGLTQFKLILDINLI